jgi:hypothetical protein
MFLRSPRTSGRHAGEPRPLLTAEVVKTGLLIGVVTVVIWLFAEAKSITELAVETEIRLVAGDDRTIRFTGAGWTGAATVRLDGPRSAIDLVSDELSRGLSLALGAPGVPRAQGDYVIDLAEALSNNPPLKGTGVSVVGIEPATVAVHIDQITRLEGVPIRIEIPGVELEREAEVAPQSVSVALPSEVAAQLGERPTVIATPSPEDLRLAEEGVRYTFRAPLSLPASVPDRSSATISPPTVQVSIVVRRRVESYTVPFAPVWLLLPPNESERWRVTIPPEDQGIEDVVVTGPSDVIERIRTQQMTVVGVVELTDVELERRIEAKAVAFPLLPDSVTVDAAGRPIRLVIEERAAPAESPANPPPGE